MSWGERDGQSFYGQMAWIGKQYLDVDIVAPDAKNAAEMLLYLMDQ
jgi:hypothetical protein